MLAFAAAMLMTGAIPPDMKRDIDSWRAEKEREMQAPDSPFAFAGHAELAPGHNTLGSGADDTLRFDSPGLPARVLDLEVVGGRVKLKVLVPMVSLDGQPIDQAELRPNDFLDAGPIRLVYGGGLDLTVYDRSRKQALDFHGLRYLPIDPRYRVPATFEPAAAGKTLILETTQHQQRELTLRGVLHFTLDGRPLSLEGFQLGSSSDLFVIFKDATSGTQTYGAGRFLWVKSPVNGKTVVDFNLAWNPLCAYSDAYNCPLAPPENRLPVPIPVGEAPYHH